MKSFSHYMRTLHRDVGFFLIGLATIYSLSGIVLIYRDTDFLKYEKQNIRQLEANLDESQLGQALRLRNFKVQKKEGDIFHFDQGTYNVSTGEAIYKTVELPWVVNQCVQLHKSASNNAKHWINLIFGILLLFLTISSFWMFKKGSKSFKRGMYFAGAGVLFVMLILSF